MGDVTNTTEDVVNATTRTTDLGAGIGVGVSVVGTQARGTAIPILTRYPCRIATRMTRQERAIIGKKAQESDLSVSRYLVELAVRETDLRPEDIGRLQRLKFYFDEAADRLRRLAAMPVFRESGKSRQATSRLQEVLCVLESLSTEIGRRLP